MIELDRARIREIKERELLKITLYHHLEEGHSISLWRSPNSSLKHLIVCTEGLTKLDDVSLEDSEPGFIFSPFDSNSKKIFLKANHSLTFENGVLLSSENFNPDTYQNSASPVDFNEKPLPFYSTSTTNSFNLDKQRYQQLVEKAISGISEGEFEKIVPARCKTVDLESALDLLASFDELCTLYPNAFVSLVSTPETGTWLGASPELLVQVTHKMHFKTAALAGTQLLQLNTDLKSIAWTQKEIEEQALVSRYIVNCFKQIRLREFEERGPKTWQAGNLLHLKTDFEVDMIATNFPQLGSVMLKLLHPTSAVCGMPRDVSIEFLKKEEHFDRQYFSGFLGPVKYQSESSVYVNLRCLQWSNEKVTLYAGAGVTIDSVPEKEWEETEMKLNTLLRIINN